MSDYTTIEETENGYRHVVVTELRYLDPDDNEIDESEYADQKGDEEGYGGGGYGQ